VYLLFRGRYERGRTKRSRPITVQFDSGGRITLDFRTDSARCQGSAGKKTALSFLLFTATNQSDKALTGVATYYVLPPKDSYTFRKFVFLLRGTEVITR